MAINSISNSSAILAPDEVESLLLAPVEQQSIAVQSSTPLRTESHALRIPATATDPTAAWTREGEEIDISQAQFSEVTATPRKLAGLSILSNELASDSNPAAAELIGSGLVRDISRRVDEAFFGVVSGPGADVAPAGLNAAAVTELHSPSVGTWNDLDVVDEGVFRAQVAGASVSAWIVSPRTYKQLVSIKEASGSGRGLLQADATQPAARLMGGRPVLVSGHVEDDVLWGIDASQSFVVVRQDVSLESDSSAFFSADSSAVRAIMRIAFAFSNPAGIVKIVADLDDPGDGGEE